MTLGACSLFLALGLGWLLVLLGLESVVLMKEVVVERSSEHGVDLLGEGQLGHLQLAQAVGHGSSTHVGADHLLQELQVSC